METINTLGAVVIGRNEGERLRRCLQSLITEIKHIVYVDSGSTDNSVAIANELGVAVVPLDLATPFTAARARNTGFKFLIQQQPELTAIQFIDGDCEINSDWISIANTYLAENPQVAIVCGRTRERFPNASIYNLLCDLEWDTPLGETNACGGVALILVSAFQEVNGYNPTLIAGEEPEMCFRLRQKNWKIWRLDAEMTLHDAAMTTIKQWWSRTKRSGHAYTEGCFLHGKSAEKYNLKETKSIIIFALILPLIIIISSVIIDSIFFAITLLYIIQIIRIIKYKNLEIKSLLKASLYGCFVILAKFPQFVGLISFLWQKLLGKQHKIIEYK